MSVEEFIVTGQIPGTQIYISFENIIAGVAVLTGIWMLYLVAKHVATHKPESITPEIITTKKTAKKAEVLLIAEDLHAEALTIVHPTQSA